ncbi:MAG: VWA domain-containing protein [Planctomycetota bacterium]|nr:MAG: VWA domain-containing protein [Planctomycetota bacterium]
MLLACALWLAQSTGPELADLEQRLRQATDKNSYESSGAYEAARELAELRSPAAMRLRLELFDQKLDTYRGVYLRDWFYSGMQRAASFEEAQLLAAAAADRKRSELQRLLCLRALAACPAQVPAKPLLDKVFDKAPPALQREWQRTLGRVFAAGRLEAEGKSESQKLSATVRERLRAAGPPYSGLAALPGAETEDWARILQAALEAKDPCDRAEALRSLSGGEAHLRALDLALQTSHCGLRTAALESAVADREFRAIPGLIAALEQEAGGARGRFLGDCARALQALTGQQFGTSTTLWRRWWADESDRFLADALQGKVQAAALPTVGHAPGKEVHGDQATVAQIFGLPVDSQRVAIVVDGSGSMRIGKLGEKTCAEAAAGELEKYLGQLPDGALFNVVVIADAPVPLYKKLTAAAKRSRGEAVAFLRGYDFGGTSALYDVLLSVQNEPDVDTIVLIGDGGGSSGSHQYAGHMLDGLRREYMRTGVRIHGICVGDDAPKIRFMEDLAAATGGRTKQP